MTTDLPEFARILSNPNEHANDKSGQGIGKAPLLLEEVATALHANATTQSKMLEGRAARELRHLEEPFRRKNESRS